MDSPDIDALVEEIGDQLLARLGKAGGGLSNVAVGATWNGSPQALELDLSEADHSDAETRELALAAAERGLYAVWTCGARLAAAVAALTAAETAVGVVLPRGLSSVAKSAEAQNAMRLGAQAVEVPLEAGLVRAGEWDRLFADLRAVEEPVAATGVAFVVGIAAPDLDSPSLVRAAAVARLAGANAVRVRGSAKTHQPPEEEHVRVVAKALGPEAETLAEGLAANLTAAGATRLSSSAALSALAPIKS